MKSHEEPGAAQRNTVNTQLRFESMTAQVQPNDQSLPLKWRLGQMLQFWQSRLGGGVGLREDAGEYFKGNPNPPDFPFFWSSLSD